MLELAILGLLKERPMHGYDLRKRLREEFGLLSNLSFGSLYPALSRLVSGGAIRVVGGTAPAGGGEAIGAEAGAPLPGLDIPTIPASPIPPTGSIGGERAAWRARREAARSVPKPFPAHERAPRQGRGARSRKVYEMTTEGEALFERLLADGVNGADDPRSFTLRLAFARHLTPEARLGLFVRHRSQLADRLARARRAIAATGRALDSYERSLMEHSTETTERDISWVDRLIAAERQEDSGTDSGLVTAGPGDTTR